MDITSLTAVELGKKIKAKELSVADAVKASLDQIDRVEKDVHSFVTIDREGAFRRADEVQKQIDSGSLDGPLAGVPVAVKDNMCTKGMLTTCSSKRSGILRRRERSSLARRTWTNSQWEARQRLRITE